MSQHNLPELPARWYSVDSAGAATLCVDESDATRQAEQNNKMYPRFAPHRAVKLAALSEQGAGEAVAGKWDGAEEWMPLAWELCADECGEESCTELVWEGGPIPEPWGDRWLKYEDEAKRLIALVRKHTRPQVAQPPLKATETMIDAAIANADKFSGKGWRATYAGIYEAMAEAAQPARVVDCAYPRCLWGTDPTCKGPCRLSTPPAAPALFNGLTQAETDASASVAGLAPSQQAGEVTELRAALWHVKNTAISLSDAQVIALEALAAYDAKKAGA